MRLRLGAPRAALVVAPHPDDEVIGAFGLIQALRRSGTRVRVVVVTDGGASHPSSAAWPRARLARQRRRESLWALRRLGLTAAQVRFLALPDGALPQAAGAARRRIGAEVRQLRGLDLIVGPTADDDHADHRVVAAALAAAPAPGARRLAYSVWPTPHVAGRRRRTLPVLGGALAKRTAIGLHRTQTGAITDDPRGFAITDAQLRGFSRPWESFLEGLPR